MDCKTDYCVLGVDVGATKIKVGIVNEEGHIIKSRQYPTVCTDQESTVSSVLGGVSDFMRDLEGNKPSGVGVGLVGYVDEKKGYWVGSMNARISTPEPIAKRLQDLTGIPVYIDNDVHAATCGEMIFGVGRESENFILMSLGTGLAAGIVSGGQLIRGIGNFAGEMGHMLVDTNGEPCSCGHRGCLERISAGAGLINTAIKMLNDYPDSMLNDIYKKGDLHSSSIFDASIRGDELAGKITEKAIVSLGIGVVNVFNLLNPEYIVFAGGVARTLWYIDRVKEYVYAHAAKPAIYTLKDILVSRISTLDVGLLGAACLCFLQKKINIEGVL